MVHVFMTPDLLWYVAEERKVEEERERESWWHEKEIKRKKENGEEENQKKLHKKKKTNLFFFSSSSSWRNSLLATHNHVSQSTGERKKKKDPTRSLSFFLQVDYIHKILSDLFLFFLLHSSPTCFIPFLNLTAHRVDSVDRRFFSLRWTIVWNVGMRNCHPSEQTPQEMGSLIFS